MTASSTAHRTAIGYPDRHERHVTGPQPGLVAAYTFENVSDGAGGVTDVSGNGHNATLLTLTTAANVIVDPTLSHAQAINEDQPLVFSDANHNAITVSDQDGDDLTVTLAVEHGTVTLASTNDLDVSTDRTARRRHDLGRVAGSMSRSKASSISRTRITAVPMHWL